MTTPCCRLAEELAQIGPRRILAPAGGPFDEHLMMMMGGEGGGGGFFDKARKLWQEAGEKLLPEKLLTTQELRELEEAVAREKMTSKMVDKVAENTEHYIRCHQAVFELPIDDLIALYRYGHKFFFPEKLADLFPKQALESAGLRSVDKLTCEHLPGVSFSVSRDGLRWVTVVPEKFRYFGTELFANSAELLTTEGIVRHEAGQRLNTLYKWKEATHIYESEKKTLNELFYKLELKDLEILERDRIRAIKQNLQNYLNDEVGFEQTIADLYAAAHKGSAIPEIEMVLKESFTELYDSMNKKNWFRNNLEEF